MTTLSPSRTEDSDMIEERTDNEDISTMLEDVTCRLQRIVITASDPAAGAVGETGSHCKIVQECVNMAQMLAKTCTQLEKQLAEQRAINARLLSELDQARAVATELRDMDRAIQDHERALKSTQEHVNVLEHKALQPEREQQVSMVAAVNAAVNLQVRGLQEEVEKLRQEMMRNKLVLYVQDGVPVDVQSLNTVLTSDNITSISEAVSHIYTYPPMEDRDTRKHLVTFTSITQRDKVMKNRQWLKQHYSMWFAASLTNAQKQEIQKANKIQTLLQDHGITCTRQNAAMVTVTVVGGRQEKVRSEAEALDWIGKSTQVGGGGLEITDSEDQRPKPKPPPPPPPPPARKLQPPAPPSVSPALHPFTLRVNYITGCPPPPPQPKSHVLLPTPGPEEVMQPATAPATVNGDDVLILDTSTVEPDDVVMDDVTHPREEVRDQYMNTVLRQEDRAHVLADDPAPEPPTQRVRKDPTPPPAPAPAQAPAPPPPAPAPPAQDPRQGGRARSRTRSQGPAVDVLGNGFETPASNAAYGGRGRGRGRGGRGRGRGGRGQGGRGDDVEREHGQDADPPQVPQQQPPLDKGKAPWQAPPPLDSDADWPGLTAAIRDSLGRGEPAPVGDTGATSSGNWHRHIPAVTLPNEPPPAPPPAPTPDPGPVHAPPVLPVMPNVPAAAGIPVSPNAFQALEGLLEG